MNKVLKKIVPVVMLAFVLAGCFGSGDAEDANKEVTLKVMYYDEGAFNRLYGKLYSSLYPNVNIEVVEMQVLYERSLSTSDYGNLTYDEAFVKLIEEKKPDVLMLENREYARMAQNGQLLDLDTMIAMDNYDAEGLLPGMIDYMKEVGGGQLYGIPTGINSKVLYFNKGLFDKYKITYPTDHMTWDEVLDLARQFPIDGNSDQRVYGLKAGFVGDMADISSLLASSEGLTYFSPNNKKLAINTDNWKRNFETSLSIANSKALYMEPGGFWGVVGGGSAGVHITGDPYLQDPFLAGRLAMVVENTYLISQVKSARLYSENKDQIISDWDMVTMPVSAQNPDKSPGTTYGNIMAISQNSSIAEEAWKFIAYITGDEYARVNSSSVVTPNGMFPVRTKYIKDGEGRNIAAFYKLKPLLQADKYADSIKLPTQFETMFDVLKRKEFDALLEDQKTVSEALELLQEEGEELLSQESMTDKEINEYYQKQRELNQRILLESAGEIVDEGSVE